MENSAVERRGLFSGLARSFVDSSKEINIKGKVLEVLGVVPNLVTIFKNHLLVDEISEEFRVKKVNAIAGELDPWGTLEELFPEMDLGVVVVPGNPFNPYSSAFPGERDQHRSNLLKAYDEGAVLMMVDAPPVLDSNSLPWWLALGAGVVLAGTALGAGVGIVADTTVQKIERSGEPNEKSEIPNPERRAFITGISALIAGTITALNTQNFAKLFGVTGQNQQVIGTKIQEIIEKKIEPDKNTVLGTVTEILRPLRDSIMAQNWWISMAFMINSGRNDLNFGFFADRAHAEEVEKFLKGPNATEKEIRISAKRLVNEILESLIKASLIGDEEIDVKKEIAMQSLLFPPVVIIQKNGIKEIVKTVKFNGIVIKTPLQILEEEIALRMSEIYLMSGKTTEKDVLSILQTTIKNRYVRLVEGLATKKQQEEYGKVQVANVSR